MGECGYGCLGVDEIDQVIELLAISQLALIVVTNELVKAGPSVHPADEGEVDRIALGGAFGGLCQGLAIVPEQRGDVHQLRPASGTGVRDVGGSIPCEHALASRAASGRAIIKDGVAFVRYFSCFHCGPFGEPRGNGYI